MNKIWVVTLGNKHFLVTKTDGLWEIKPYLQ